MLVGNEEIERIKRDVDLVALVRSEGVALKKRGRNWVGLCPFHDEKTPSFTVNPKTNLYNCFGCPKGDSGGNAITFLMKRRGLSFRDAFESLSKGALRHESSVAAAPAPVEPRVRVRRQKLLARVAAYYRRTFIEKPEGRDYLAARGITNAAAIETFAVGLADGTLLSIAPKDPTVLDDLRALGILTEHDRELFDGCVTFPLHDEAHAVVGMYGRRLENGTVNHLYLPGQRHGLAHRSAACGRVVLCESVIDALTLFSYAIPSLGCYGTQGVTAEHIQVLNRPSVAEVLVCFDGDEAGRHAATEVAQQLRETGKPLRLIDLPDGEDINSLVQRHGIERLRELLEIDPLPKAEVPTAAPMLETTPHGFIMRKAGRTYEVKGVSRQGTQLRATLKASLPDHRFELATIDLYSHRSRLWFAGLCKQLFMIAEDEARADMNEVLVHIEEQAQSKPDADCLVELTDDERSDAERLLSAPDIIDRIAEDMETIGYTGERINKIICYLAAVSRKLDEPLSVLIQSRSAAGKSALQDAVLRLVPDEDALHYSRLTDQALFYQSEDALAHKLLAIEEAEGMGGAAYSIRAMQSQKKLTVATTGKDPASGKMRTEHYTVHGPLAVMLTTTRTDFDQETMSRFLLLTVDESQEMTAKIHAQQREQDTLAGLLRKKSGEHISGRHHNAQRLLEPLSVVNPYAPQLSFSTKSLRSRRDHKKYLGLIKSIAFLRHRQRAVHEVVHAGERLRYIEATLDDIALANELGRDVLGQSCSDLSPQGRRLLSLIKKMLSNGHAERVGRDGVGAFTRRLLREYTGWSDWQTRTHLSELVELEMVHVRSGSMGKEYLYALGDEADSTSAQPLFAFTDAEGLRQAFLTMSAAEP